MTNFQHIQNLSFEDLSVFLDSLFEEQPWNNYYQREYCDNCPTIDETINDRTYKYGYCELNDGVCKFFPDVNTLDEIEIIKIWLNAEHKGAKSEDK